MRATSSGRVRRERKFMENNQEELVHARALRANILAAPQVWLPRREVLLEWLNAFLLRAAVPAYKVESAETADLTALDHFLRKQKVPVA